MSDRAILFLAMAVVAVLAVSALVIVMATEDPAEPPEQSYLVPTVQ